MAHAYRWNIADAPGSPKVSAASRLRVVHAPDEPTGLEVRIIEQVSRVGGGAGRYPLPLKYSHRILPAPVPRPRRDQGVQLVVVPLSALGRGQARVGRHVRSAQGAAEALPFLLVGD